MKTKRVERRKHSAQFRAGALQACRRADAFVVAIALRSGLNAKVVCRRLRETAQCVNSGASSHTLANTKPGPEFIAVQMPAPATAASPEVRMEVRRPGAATVTVSWPGQCAGECAAWLRECLQQL